MRFARTLVREDLSRQVGKLYTFVIKKVKESYDMLLKIVASKGAFGRLQIPMVSLRVLPCEPLSKVF